jgi:hypothetical protein
MEKSELNKPKIIYIFNIYNLYLLRLPSFMFSLINAQAIFYLLRKIEVCTFKDYHILDKYSLSKVLQCLLQYINTAVVGWNSKGQHILYIRSKGSPMVRLSRERLAKDWQHIDCPFQTKGLVPSMQEDIT